MQKKHMSIVCWPVLQAAALATSKVIQLGLLNAGSINNKGLLLNNTDRGLDFLCLSKTWHQPNEYISLKQCTQSGYTYLDCSHTSGHGGGLDVICRTDGTVKSTPVPAISYFECMAFKSTGSVSVLPVLIYRPPKAQL
jgi:hypothetical protein